jgi:hypothetical protein
MIASILDLHSALRTLTTVVSLMVGLTIGAFAAHASDEITITFDDLLATPTSNAGHLVPQADRLSNQLISAYGIGFNSEAPYVAVANGGETAPSPPNFIGGVTADGILSYQKPVVFTFYAFDTSRPAIITHFSVTGDLTGNGDTVTLFAYDLNGNIVATDTETDTAPRGGTVWSVSGQGIHTVVWPGNPSEPGGIGLDNVTFTTPQPIFAGTPGKANCHGKSISALARRYGGLNGAAAALDFSSVGALQDAIIVYCEE